MRTEPTATAEKHPGIALAWVAAFVVCLVADVYLARWTFLPFFVAAFYAGMIVIDLLAYPLLRLWRAWLRSRSARSWYMVEVGGLWIGTSLVLALSAPRWLEWGWEGVPALEILGAALLSVSVGVGAWALWKMGWARVLFTPAMFPQGTEEEGIPQRLVVEGPYRYVRNPLYITDVCVMLGTALLSGKLFLIGVLLAYMLQLGMQVYFEERELKMRFGRPYLRYLRLVPRFLPRIRPVDPSEIGTEAER